MREEKEEYEKKLEEAKHKFEKKIKKEAVINKYPFLSNISQDASMTGMVKRPLQVGSNIVGK